MDRPCNLNIVEALRLAEKLLLLAEKGMAEAEDDSCVVMYGVIRDCGYKIRLLAEREQGRHDSSGRWLEPGSSLSA